MLRWCRLTILSSGQLVKIVVGKFVIAAVLGRGKMGMVPISQIPGNITCGFIGCGMVAPVCEFCHPQAFGRLRRGAALEAATQN